MTADLTKPALCTIIESALKTANKTDTLSEPVTMASKMGSPREWDSLSFVSVFMAVSTAFEVELDDDDAIHFQSVAAMYPFLEEVLEE